MIFTETDRQIEIRTVLKGALLCPTRIGSSPLQTAPMRRLRFPRLPCGRTSINILRNRSTYFLSIVIFIAFIDRQKAMPFAQRKLCSWHFPQRHFFFVVLFSRDKIIRKSTKMGGDILLPHLLLDARINTFYNTRCLPKPVIVPFSTFWQSNSIPNHIQTRKMRK